MNAVKDIDKIICLVSLWYSPGHLDHLYALSEMFEDLGYKSCIYLSDQYSHMVDTSFPVFFEKDGKLPEADLYLSLIHI